MVSVASISSSLALSFPRILSPRDLGQQISDTHQVVGSHHPQEVLPYPSQTSELCLSEPANLLRPAEALLHPFAYPLTDFLVRMTGYFVVNRRPAGTFQVSRNVRCNIQVSQ